MTNWQSIVEQHGDGVWRIAYRLVGNHADAADCMQEAFTAALEFSRRQRVRSWPALLGRLATCRALDLLRRRIRHRARHDAPADWAAVPASDPGPAADAEAAELAVRLRRSLAELPDGQAEVFCLRFVNDLSYRDIARQLGMKPSAVGVALHRARKRLRELLNPCDIAVDQQAEVSP